MVSICQHSNTDIIQVSSHSSLSKQTTCWIHAVCDVSGISDGEYSTVISDGEYSTVISDGEYSTVISSSLHALERIANCTEILPVT